MLNQCTLIGTIASEITERDAGKSKVMNFRLNTWSIRGDRRFDGWHTIQVWSPSLRDDIRSFPEGKLVMCQGEYKTRQSEKDGVKVYYSSLTAFSVQAVDGMAADDAADDGAPKSTPPQGNGHGPIKTKTEEEDFGF